MDAVTNFLEKNASPLLDILDFIIELFSILGTFFGDLIAFVFWISDYVTSFSVTEFTIASIPIICLLMIAATVILKIILHVIP